MAVKKKSATTKAKSKSKPKPKAKAGAKATAKPRVKTAAKSKTPAKSKKKVDVKKAAKKASSKAAQKPIRSTKTSPVKASKNVKAKSTAKNTHKPSKGIKDLSSHLLPKKVTKKLDFSDFVTPLDDRLFVQLSAIDRKTPGGLFLPDTVADLSGNLEGFVVAVGRGHVSKKGHLRPMDVKIGDRILFSPYAGSKVIVQNEDLVILREADVMGVVSK